MDGPRVEALGTTVDFTTIEVHCAADPDVEFVRSLLDLE
jgi:hypothetical protein